LGADSSVESALISTDFKAELLHCPQGNARSSILLDQIKFPVEMIGADLEISISTGMIS